jgi:LuxR family maltose regulon positive regulatory protein
MEQLTAARIRQPKIIDRPRLTRQLDACGARIILLIAPAGYGKTTLAREWLRNRPHAWFTATAASVDVAALATGVAHAMQKVVPGVGERMLTRLRLSTLPSAEAEVFADMLAEDLETWPADAWLVLDDYQAISGVQPGESFFSTLVTKSLVSVLITSRVHPTWATARSRMYGLHHELGTVELAMTAQEASSVLEDPAALELVTGWPALVALAATASTLPTESAIFDSSALHAFFAEELFRSIPAEVQLALCQLSACPDLSLQTATRFLGSERASAALETGVDFGFITLTDDTVRLHPLIRRFLATQISHVAQDADEATRRLAEFLIRERCWDEAFAVIERLASSDLLDSLLTQSVNAMFSAGRHATVARWVTLARELLENATPALLFAEAELASREGRQARAEALAAQAARQSDDRSFKARAWNLAGRSAHLIDQYSRALEYHRRAEQEADEPSDLREAIWGQMAAGWQIDPALSASLLPRLTEIGRDDLETHLRIANAMHHFSLHSERPEEIQEVMERALILVEHSRNPLIATSLLNAASRWQAMRACYREALDIVDREMKVVEQHRLAFVLPNALNVRAIALIGLRDWTGASRAIRAAEAHATDFDDIHNLVDAHAIRLRLYLSRRDLAKALAADARRWPRLPGESQHLEYLATAALVHAVAGTTDDARDLLKRVGEPSSVEIRSFAYAAAAVCDLREGRDKSLKRFCDYSRAFECYDAVITAWRAYPESLAAMVERLGFAEDAARIAERARDRRLLRRLNLPTQPVTEGTDLLSKREREVHELLAQGHSNREIARMLYIEEVTVKVHIRHIFEKLGVRTRVEAATRYSQTDDA